MRWMVVPALWMSTCACERPAAPPAAPPPAAAQVVAKIDAGDVLARLTAQAPAVRVGVRQLNPSEVALTLDGDGPAAIAFEMLTSLPQALPGVQLEKLTFNENSWSARLLARAAAADAPAAPNRGSYAATIGVVRPVFAGDAAVLASGTVDVTDGRLSFSGAFAKDRTLAALPVPTGWSLASADSGPPVVFVWTASEG